MKKTIARIALTTLLLVASGSTPVLAGAGSTCTDLSPVLAGGGEPRPPFCPPGNSCD